MEQDLISIQKLQEVFGYSTGERTIEVTEDEYLNLLKEAKQKKLDINESNGSFILTLGELKIHIVCDFDEEEF